MELCCPARSLLALPHRRHLYSNTNPSSLLLPLRLVKPLPSLRSHAGFIRASSGSEEVSTFVSDRFDAAPSGVESTYVKEVPVSSEEVASDVVETNSAENEPTEAVNYLNQVDLKDEAVPTSEEEAPTSSDIAPNEATPTEETPVSDGTGDIMDLLKNLNLKLDSEDPYSVFVYGAAVLAVLRFSSTIVSAIDSLPLFPKAMELVGLAFTLWFSFKYLIFKERRDELVAKFYDLKEQIIGPPDE